MKAKYGIVSVWCWVLSVMLFIGILLWGRDASSFLPWFWWAWKLLLPAGVILAFLGAVKNEDPEGYYLVGFFLNFLPLVCFLWLKF